MVRMISAAHGCVRTITVSVCQVLGLIVAIWLASQPNRDAFHPKVGICSRRPETMQMIRESSRQALRTPRAIVDCHDQGRHETGPNGSLSSITSLS